MIVRIGPTQVVVVLEKVLEALLDSVEVGHLVEGTIHAPLGTGAIVGGDNDDRVVQFAGCSQRIQHAAELGIGDRYKLIEASLEWVGQPCDLGRAPVPFLEELREGLARSMGQAPTMTDILQLLIANDRVSAFFGEFLIGWEVLPGESRMDLSKEDLEEARQTLQGWWEDVETQPQPFLAEMWRPRYESIRSGMEP